MILPVLISLMVKANCEYRLSEKWHSFVKNHVVDWDKNDPETREWLDEQEKDKDDEK